jgi:hypothetical protein
MPVMTSNRASHMPHDTSFDTPFTPEVAALVTPFHANGLGLGIRDRGERRCRGGRCEAQRSRQSHQGKSLSTRDRFRFDGFVHVKTPVLGGVLSCA